jgi:GWxTD domain-containing protein
MRLINIRLITFILLVSPTLPRALAQDTPLKPKKVPLRVVTIHWDKKWLNEDVVYIITDQERTDFKKLTTDTQRDEFVEQFWERRNPTPGSPENTFKEEHYRRTAYANTQFAAALPGWKTDRGRIYIVYGPPDKIDSQRGSRNSATTVSGGAAYGSELWYYSHIEGMGRDVTFKFADCGDDSYPLADIDVGLPDSAPDIEMWPYWPPQRFCIFERQTCR